MRYLYILTTCLLTQYCIAQESESYPLPAGFPEYIETGNKEADDQRYDQLKREWYRSQGQELVNDEYGFVNFSDEAQPVKCDLVFHKPNSLNQPSELTGNWVVKNIIALGGDNEDQRASAQSEIWHDLPMGSILQLQSDHGTFLANTNVKDSYWKFDETENRIFISSYAECVCYIWDVSFELVQVTQDELIVIMDDVDEDSAIRYQLQYVRE
ncbi:MAG: hypothetical protein RL266_2424 [Bacteroidota bacterium]|jgi:hypothetical protein